MAWNFSFEALWLRLAVLGKARIETVEMGRWGTCEPRKKTERLVGFYRG